MNLPAFFSDVQIEYCPVPPELPDAFSNGVLWQAAQGRFFLDLPGVVRYLVEGGNRVRIETAAGADVGAVQRFFRMSPLAALVYQRGLLPLHACAVAVEGGAVVVAGDSGAGKTALLVKLMQRGFSMLADDLTVISLDTEGRPVVPPLWPEAALWPGTAELLGFAGSLPMYDSNRKLYSGSLSPRPVPLRALYHLSTSKESDVEIADISGAGKFAGLTALSYNTHIADALMDRAGFMRVALAMISVATFRTLKRPGGNSLDALADALLKDCA